MARVEPKSQGGRPPNSEAQSAYLQYWVRRLEEKKGAGAARLNQSLLTVPGDAWLKPRDVGIDVFQRIMLRRNVPTRPVTIGRSSDPFDLIERVEEHIPGSSSWIKPSFLPLLDARLPLPSATVASKRADLALSKLQLRRLSPFANLALRPHEWDFYEVGISALQWSSRTESLSALSFLLLEARRLGAERVVWVTERALRRALICHLRKPESVRKDYALRRELRQLWRSFLFRIGTVPIQPDSTAVTIRPGTPFLEPDRIFWDFEDLVLVDTKRFVTELAQAMQRSFPPLLDESSEAGRHRWQRQREGESVRSAYGTDGTLGEGRLEG